MNCPFYGRSGLAFPVLFDSGGNQCALIVTSHAPCWMEVNERKLPDWQTCPLVRLSLYSEHAAELLPRFVVPRDLR